MTDKTIGIIYALKDNEVGSFDAAVKNFMVKYTGSDPGAYSKANLTNIAMSAVIDYIGTADDPSKDVRDLLEYMHCYKPYRDAEPVFEDRVRMAIWQMLQLVQVKDGADSYVNGFREV